MYKNILYIFLEENIIDSWIIMYGKYNQCLLLDLYLFCYCY